MYVAFLHYETKKDTKWIIDLFATDKPFTLRVDETYLQDFLKAKTFYAMVNKRQIIYEGGILTEEILDEFWHNALNTHKGLSPNIPRTTAFKELMKIENRFAIYSFIDVDFFSGTKVHGVLVVDNKYGTYYMNKWASSSRFLPKTCAYTITGNILFLRLLTVNNSAFKDVQFEIGG